jgi:hypothetical protein
MQEETGITPPALKNRPELHDDWVFTQQIWRDLNGSRRYHMGGAAGIPFSEFYLWARAHGFSCTDLTDAWEAVHRYDEIWLEEQAIWQKAQADQKK